MYMYMKSLSARRAWIENKAQTHTVGEVLVALRKESVDRKVHAIRQYQLVKVALRKESVDRKILAKKYI